jgi:hypothetical protein
VKAHERIARRRDERGESRHHFDGCHDAVLGASSCVLDAISDSPAWQTTETVEREGRSGSVTQQTFASEVVAGRECDSGVKVPSFVVGDEGEELRRFACGGRRDVLLELRERAALHRDRRAGLERSLLRVLVVLLDLARVEVSVLSKPAVRPALDAANDGVELELRRRRQRMKAHAMLFVAYEDAVQEDYVVVNVQVEASTKSLDERDRACHAPIDSTELLGPRAITRGDDFDEDATQCCQDIGFECGEHA